MRTIQTNHAKCIPPHHPPNTHPHSVPCILGREKGRTILRGRAHLLLPVCTRACACMCALVCNLLAILFNRIILPECTAETAERQMTLQARPGCISDTQRAIPAHAPTHPEINPGDVSANLIPGQRRMGKLLRIAAKVQANKYPSPAVTTSQKTPPLLSGVPRQGNSGCSSSRCGI